MNITIYKTDKDVYTWDGNYTWDVELSFKDIENITMKKFSMFDVNKIVSLINFNEHTEDYLMGDSWVLNIDNNKYCMVYLNEDKNKNTCVELPTEEMNYYLNNLLLLMNVKTNMELLKIAGRFATVIYTF